jgi:hypothetical protein
MCDAFIFGSLMDVAKVKSEKFAHEVFNWNM